MRDGFTHDFAHACLLLLATQFRDARVALTSLSLSIYLYLSISIYLSLSIYLYLSISSCNVLRNNHPLKVVESCCTTVLPICLAQSL